MILADLVRLGLVVTLWIAFVWVGAAWLAGWVAAAKGRDPFAWFVIGLFLSPLLALLALNAVPDPEPLRSRRPAVAGAGGTAPPKPLGAPAWDAGS